MQHFPGRYRAVGSLYACGDCPEHAPGEPVVIVDRSTHDRWHAEQYAHLDTLQGTMFG